MSKDVISQYASLIVATSWQRLQSDRMEDAYTYDGDGMVASSLEFVLESSVKDSPGRTVLPLKTKVVLLAYLVWKRTFFLRTGA